MQRLDDDVVKAYLARLGLEAEPPSADALSRLHQRHVERVPYETLWIHAGEPWSIDAPSAAARIAFQRRGGYCYHLNGAFALLLGSLGYQVRRRSGGVHGPGGPDLAADGNHLVLTVTGLPTDANPAGAWYVDAGLGDALHEPIPLAAGTVQQGPFRLTLEHGDTAGGWHLVHDPRGGFTGMAWRSDPVDEARLESQHQWLSTAPESGFVKLAIAQTRDGGGVDVMHGLMVKRVGEAITTAVALTDRAQWFDALAEMFGLTFSASAPGAIDRLWERTLAAHRAWEAAQEAGG
jgi:arylamine N-acetyltransferase